MFNYGFNYGIKDVNFFYVQEVYVVGIKIDNVYSHNIYLNMGKDNRPFDIIKKDVLLAIEMAKEEKVPDYLLSIELPKLLGWKRYRW